jgi:hypothetical protein
MSHTTQSYDQLVRFAQSLLAENNELRREKSIALRKAELVHEECAKLCLEIEPFYGQMFAAAIRERGKE